MSAADPMRINPRQLTVDDIERLGGMKAYAHELHEIMSRVVPEGRERALALTNLEQSVMWATKGITG
jgi:hypothetical protein